MRIASAIAITFSALYFAAAPTSAQATAVIRGNSCFSGVSSDEADAREECERVGFTCTAPKEMRCRFDNTRHMYICQCKDPPKNPATYSDERRKRDKHSMPPSESETAPPPEEELPPQETPGALAAVASGC